MEEEVLQPGRSLAETPTYSVASVITVMVFVCFLVERSIYRFSKWLKKTKRKALFASLEKIKEELMLLGLISLLLAQSARWISEICVNSSLFSSKFYICSEQDLGTNENFMVENSSSLPDETIPKGLTTGALHQCREGHEPFVSYEGLEQLHRFLFVLGITHVLYSCLAVGLAMSKIYSWCRWENQAQMATDGNLQGMRNKVMRRQTTFVFHHTSHPWSRNPILIWMLCFLRQFRSSIQKSDYLALRLGFITEHKLPLSYDFHKYMVRSMEDEFHGILGISWPLWIYAIVCIFVNIHGLNIYFWLSFIPAILVMLIGTKLQHVVSTLALEIMEQQGPFARTQQVKPRDGLFWFKKPDILLWLIQFVIFQNSFEMASFIWTLWGLKERSCFMRNHYMIITRLTSGVLVQFWCSYMTVPLNVIVSQMGSRCKKALVTESVRDSLHSWCKRVKQKSKHESLHSHTARSVCSLESTIDERDEITVVSGTLTRSSSLQSLNQITVTSVDQLNMMMTPNNPQDSTKGADYFSESLHNNDEDPEIAKVETLLDLFQKT